MSRHRTVVDDAPAARRLRLHHPEGRLGAEERPVQVGVHHGAPLCGRERFQRHGRCADAGIVEQHVHTPEMRHCPVKEGIHGVRIGHIGGNHQRAGSITGLREGCVVSRAFRQGGTAAFPVRTGIRFGRGAVLHVGPGGTMLQPELHGFLQGMFATTGQCHSVAGFQKGACHCPADAAASPGDDGNGRRFGRLGRIRHGSIKKNEKRNRPL